MMDGPHIFGFSPAAFCINLTSALASARLSWSVSASINSATLILVGLVLLSAIHPPLRLFAWILLPLQEFCHGFDVHIRLVYKRHVSGLRQDHQFRSRDLFMHRARETRVRFIMVAADQ